MKKKLLLFSVMAILILPAFASAAEEKAALPAGMDEAKMAEMKAKGAPNENHKVLEQFAGDWNYDMTWRMSAEAEPMVSKGTNSNQMIFGGRFLEQKVTGEGIDGEGFEGVGYTGYDNVRKEYSSVWMDGMSTGMMISTSQYDPATQTFSEKGDFSCPMTGEERMKFRGEWKLIDADHYLYTMYGNGPDGAEYKMLEGVYQRQ